MNQIIFLGLGLIVGSFLNAVIYRLHLKESFASGRSRCLHCGTTLNPMDLIPVLSFIFLRGRCRYCKAKLSWQYPLVESFTGIMFLLFGLQTGFAIEFELLRSLVFGCIFIVVAVYDFKHYLILDKVIFPAIVAALVFNLASDLLGNCSLASINCQMAGGVLGAVIAAGFFYLQYVLSSGRWIGFGDVKLGILLGLVAGWPYVLAVLFLAYMLGALAGVGLVIAGEKQMSSKLPFGTFLAFSAIINLLYGAGIVEWYLALIGIY